MSRYVVTHNGYGIEYFDDAAQAEAYMFDELNKHKDLDPKEIYRGYSTDNQAENESRFGGTIKSVIVWQYRTLYTEVFMFEEIED